MNGSQKFFLFTFILFFSPPTISSNINVDEKLKNSINNLKKAVEKAKGDSAKYINGKMQLLLGSTLPNCEGRCKTCIPCVPVLVPLPPEKLVQNRRDYYQEIWKCGCGGNIYLPYF
ncbi:unnamed protein product [Fraxinus pennsylvanica]|uniref:Epidermal patterning factor-like protein n=1 Tax=Fraxinus pennsylvanica TaxID=56036 RepID=A0AAD2EDJ2_9LAMI|nr:unnamed protein product [Fraxinus pennsylvanica]